ncbi:MAG: hypothetical protein K9K78_06330 [Spirochaetales bacterium]|nr:hypothetical protein [Spirochaetales bacterium]
MTAQLDFVGKTYRHVNRYIEILRVLVRFGFADIVSQSKIEQFIDLSRKTVFRKTDPSIFSYSRAERIRMVFENLGPAFIKFGQLMSMRGDLIPIEVIQEMEKLQKEVPPFPAEEAKRIVEEELEQNLDDIFTAFEKEPAAAGSIAQVHHAVLKDGSPVVVKVQRPGIKELIRTDVEILHHLAVLIERYIPELRVYSLTRIIEEFSRSIEKELNFQYEVSQIERFRSYYGDLDYLYVPTSYKALTTRRVLVMEYVDGVAISKLDKLKERGLDPKTAAVRGADAVLSQIFDKGFFHADPHAGNILVLENTVICFLDYGMMGKLSPSTKKLITSILIGGVLKDSEFIMRNVLRMCESRGDVNQRKLETDISEIVDQLFFQDLESLDVPSLLQSIMRLFPDNNLILPADLYLLARALLLLQSNGERLDPEFNVSEHVKPYVRKLYRQKLKVSSLLKDMYLSVEEITELLRAFPFEIRDILDKIKNGKMRIEFEHRGLEPAQQTLERTFNRLSFAVIVAAILIGSSLIIFSGMPPLWQGYPVLGIIGFLAAGGLGLWLLVSIIRHGRM